MYTRTRKLVLKTRTVLSYHIGHEKGRSLGLIIYGFVPYDIKGYIMSYLSIYFNISVEYYYLTQSNCERFLIFG